MQKVKADKSLDYPDRDFEKPDKPITVELDCIKYNLEQGTDNQGYDEVGY
jgi:hypothetical protein